MSRCPYLSLSPPGKVIATGQMEFRKTEIHFELVPKSKPDRNKKKSSIEEFSCNFVQVGKKYMGLIKTIKGNRATVRW